MMARFFILLVVLVLCLFEVQKSTACCFIPKEPCVYQTCGCPITPSGIVACGGCACNLCDSCSITTTSIGCSSCASCFRDTSCPCKTCKEKPSPVSSCLKSLEKDCGCGMKTRIYFPEVEYPNTILEMNPFFFSNCFRF